MLAKSSDATITAEDDMVKVLHFTNKYESLILSLELSSAYRFLLNDSIVQKLPDPHLEIYTYGIRSIAADIENFKELMNKLRYIAVIDGRRALGSIKAHFSNLKRSYGIECSETILLVFSGFGESLFEDLGAYVLRRKGYLVFHQAAISMLEHLAPGVPDLELFYGITDKGYFPYEIKMLVELGEGVSINIQDEDRNRAIAGEVKGNKSDLSNCLRQLIGYLRSGLYDMGICIVPNATDKAEDIKSQGVGLLTWDSIGTPHFLPPSREWGNIERTRRLKKIVIDLVRRLMS